MFTSLAFWGLLILAAAVLHLLPQHAVRSRAAALVCLGALGILLVVGLPLWIIALLVASVAWISAGSLIACKRPHPRPVVSALLVVGPVLALWILAKQAVAAELPGLKLLYFAGFAFFLVKAWTLVKDCCDGRIKIYDPIVGAAYFFHLPTYLAGPMHYYSEFEASVARPQALSAEVSVDATFRLLVGMVKTAVLAPLLQPVSLLALQGTTDPSLTQLLLGGFGYSLVLYLDFSGYTDMAIATSRLVGVAVPENFHHPYFARNIREFWQRWHITFSRVLTAYIFVPLSRVLQRKLPQSPRAVMMIGYLITFGFAGYWHGPTANFIVWGLYHALGFITYDLFRSWRLKRRSPRQRSTQLLGAAFAQRAAATAITFTFVSIGWIFFVLPLNRIF